MSKSFLVVNSIATVYADAADANGDPTGVALTITDTPNQLAEGAVGIWTVPKPYATTLSPQLVLPGNVAALLTATDVEGFQFVVGRPKTNLDGNPHYGPVIDRRGMRKYIQADYQAPVQQVTVVGADGTGIGDLNFPATIVEGMVFTLGIVLTRHGSLKQNQWGINQKHERLSFEYVAQAADAGTLDATRINTILQGWVDDLTAKQGGFYGDVDIHGLFAFAILQNGGNSEGLSITADEGRIFEVWVSNEAEEATIQYSDQELGSAVPSPFSPGAGTGNMIVQGEIEGEAHSAGLENIVGKYNRFTPYMQQQRVLYGVASETYDTFHIRYNNPIADKTGMTAISHKEIRSVLAAPVGSAAKADVITILDAIFASV